MKALIVGDENVVNPTTLKKASIMVETAQDSEAGIELATLYMYDIILLHRVPEKKEVHIIRELRLRGVNTPIMVVADDNDLRTKLKAFELGADEYLVRPFHEDEFIARVLAIIRRSRGYSESIIRTGKIALNMSLREITVNDRRIPLEPKEYLIFEILSLRKGLNVSRETIFDYIYGTNGHNPAQIRVIDAYVYRLRKIIRELGGESCILSIRGFGYRLCDPKSA